MHLRRCSYELFAQATAITTRFEKSIVVRCFLPIHSPLTRALSTTTPVYRPCRRAVNTGVILDTHVDSPCRRATLFIPVNTACQEGLVRIGARESRPVNACLQSDTAP